MKILKVEYLCYFLLFFCIYSCQDISIENDKRITIAGNLIDESGNPIRDIEIKSFVEEYEMGNGTSDKQGNFLFTSLQSYSNDFVININQRHRSRFENFSAIDSTFASARIINYDEESFLRTDKYELPEIKPKRASK